MAPSNLIPGHVCSCRPLPVEAACFLPLCTTLYVSVALLPHATRRNFKWDSSCSDSVCFPHPLFLNESTSVARSHSWGTDFRWRLRLLCGGRKAPHYLGCVSACHLVLPPYVLILSLILIRLLAFSVLSLLSVGSVFLFTVRTETPPTSLFHYCSGPVLLALFLPEGSVSGAAWGSVPHQAHSCLPLFPSVPSAALPPLLRLPPPSILLNIPSYPHGIPRP